jgi:mono/diheme cytochrome c family protein
MMQKFLWGILFTLVVIVIGAFLVVRGGYFNFSADTETSPLEKKIAMSAMDKSTERRAPQTSNPLQPNDDTLIASARLYRDNCAGCHGDPSHMATQLGDSFNPPAPQFWMDAPDMPENENFYIIKHGVRWTGMPSWNKKLSDAQIWQVVTLLSHLDKLPDSVNQELQKPAPASN